MRAMRFLSARNRLFGTAAQVDVESQFVASSFS